MLVSFYEKAREVDFQRIQNQWEESWRNKKGKTLGQSSFYAHTLEKNALLFYREIGRKAVTIITIVLSKAQLEETEVCELNDSGCMKFWTF